MFFLAISIPFLMAIGTSFALPEPYPTRPCPSPTTTSAEKEKFFPPLTTLVTRLMCTTRSISSRPWASRSFSRSRGARDIRLLIGSFSSLRSELETALPGGLGQRLDLAVVDVAAAVEHDPRDSLAFRPFRDERADARRGLAVRAFLFALQRRVERGGVRERRAGRVVDHLRVDVAAALEHGEAGPLPRAFHPTPGPRSDFSAPLGARVRSVHRPTSRRPFRPCAG